ncbi:MAG TPA: tetratricopeptide repeat protein, partial [Prolixibacteraceae bacterium]|nr:tetratricopeptide repeat protein [Prolixibacteraceae bacterium]
KKASTGKDEMAQNAYYHLADTYIKLGEKEQARVAFEAASDLDFNDKIKEDALFSYAKLTYELSYSPFNETIKAFDKYISLYPNSERNSEAYRYLTDVFMVTRNYSDAINTIEKIQNKTASILRAYQRVTFYRGLELFNNLAYNQAIDFFDISLNNGSHNRELNARALYWKAEALYRVGDYPKSASVYNQFMRTAGAFTLDEYQSAEYNQAYAYFKMEDYKMAANHFRKYINTMEGKQSEKLADAYNRVGDYYFLNTNYALARQNYQQAYEMKSYEPDYALFQIALIQGLQRELQGKINNLERLQAGFPDSEYQDDALYELGRALERLGSNSEAIERYQAIIENHPQSNYHRKALLQMGLINYNQGNYSDALAYYKQVTKNYPGTAEAQAALLGIKNSYIELNRVDDYFAYARSLGSGANVTVSEQDSISYMAAERLYMAKSPQAKSQLEKYLRQHSNGSFAANAHFYLAEILYKEGSYTEANEHYKFVANQPDNIFTEQALSRTSELTYNAKNYQEALDYFNRLETVANSKWNTLKAYTGQMRSHFELENYAKAKEAAEKLKKTETANEALVREANYISGKSLYLTNQQQAALEPLKTVATDTKLQEGAEAKYLIADILYNLNRKDEAEKVILDFIDKGTPYQFWLGKTFLLLADIYIDKGDEFQAKHTLRSVVENYGPDNDGVKERAAQKLAAIEVREEQQEQQARDSSFQIKLNNNN